MNEDDANPENCNDQAGGNTGQENANQGIRCNPPCNVLSENNSLQANGVGSETSKATAENRPVVSDEAIKTNPLLGMLSHKVLSAKDAMWHYNLARMRAWGETDEQKEESSATISKYQENTTSDKQNGSVTDPPVLNSKGKIVQGDYETNSICELKPPSSNCINGKELSLEERMQRCNLEARSVNVGKPPKLTMLNGNAEKVDTESSKGFDDSEDIDFLSKLPTDIALKILSYLSPRDLVHGVSLVSKTWYGMAFYPSLWSVLDFRKYVINDIVLKKLPQLCDFISYIMLPDATNEDLTDEGLVTLARGCPHLNTFCAPRSSGKFTDAAIIAFTEYCRELRELHLDCLDITDVTLQYIALNLNKLEYLSVCQVKTITDNGISEVLRWCRNLRHFVSTQNHQVTDKCLRSLPYSSKSIQKLDMMMCNLDPAGIFVIGQLTNLEQLNLTQCTKLTASQLIPVLEGCKKLNSLSLNLDKRIDDACVDIIFTYLPDLRSIYLVSTIITDDSLLIMGQKGRSLIRADIGYTKVTADGARKISEMCGTLQYLGLVRCDLVPESAVEELVEQYPRITYSTFLQDTKKLLKRIELERAKELQS